MKKSFIFITLGVIFFTSCKTSQFTSVEDDIYVNPIEQQKLARIAAEQKAKQAAEARAKQEQEALAQKAKDENNPYYKDPKSDPDDYYDYKYASRINRFDNPINGAGYYDSRYTNYYTYNQNPAYYGSSIYSTYNWMPSNQFNSYSSGLSIGMASRYGYNSGFNNVGFGTGFYSGYGYNPMYCNPYNSFGAYGYNGMGFYDPYAAGFYNGYNSAAYNGWGYYNSFDPNSGYSAYVGPRGNAGGGNTQGNRSAGVDENSRSGFFRAMAQKQENTQRFTESPRRVNSNRITNENNSPDMNAGRSSNQNSGKNSSQNVNQNNGNNNTSRRGRATEVREGTNINTPNSGRSPSNSGNSNENRSTGGGRSSGSGGSSPRSGGNR